MTSNTSSNLYARAGWSAWFVLATIISLTVVYSIAIDQERSVTPAYRSAVMNWFTGQPLYNMSGHGFLYLPQAALTFAPWALLPHGASEVVWRLCIIYALAYACYRINEKLGGDGRSFWTISICTTVLAWGCARNGQSTLAITAMMMLAAIDLSESRWWRATVLLSLAVAFKPLAIVMVMLAAAIYPQVSWRMAIGMFVVAVAPFLTQRPDYVMSQYVDCVRSLQVTFNVGENEKWAQFFGMLEVARINLPGPVRTGLRLAAAVGTLFACWKAARVLAPQRAAHYLFAFSACYLMLFNSRTEGNTYAMVGPVYGVLLAEALFRLKDQRAASWMIAAVSLSVLNYELAILISPRPDAIWISPLVCTGVSGYLVAQLVSELKQSRKQVSDAQPMTTAPVVYKSAA